MNWKMVGIIAALAIAAGLYVVAAVPGIMGYGYGMGRMPMVGYGGMMGYGYPSGPGYGTGYPPVIPAYDYNNTLQPQQPQATTCLIGITEAMAAR